jgi:hypothetical protein
LGFTLGYPFAGGTTLATASPPALTQDEHVRVQSQIQTLAGLALRAVTDDELEAFIEAGERAQTLGPFLDPTAWMAGTDQLRLVLEHARALQRFRKAVQP